MLKMLFEKRADLIKKIKGTGLRQRDIAAVLGCRANLVGQKLGGFLALSATEELIIMQIIENAEKAQRKLNRKEKI
jgi:hypothetical protein